VLASWNGAGDILSTVFSWWEALEETAMGPDSGEGLREDGRVAEAKLAKKVADMADESGGRIEWFRSDVGFVLCSYIGVDVLED
jgi:hypothetical protein